MQFIPRFLAILFVLTLGSAQAQNMDNAGLDKIIRSLADTVQGGNGNWQFVVEGLPIFASRMKSTTGCVL